MAKKLYYKTLIKRGLILLPVANCRINILTFNQLICVFRCASKCYLAKLGLLENMKPIISIFNLQVKPGEDYDIQSAL